VKMFDGNGTEVFSRNGWNSTSSNKSASLQQISFEDSKNITIQVSLTNPWSYVKISYGTLKKPLNLGRENNFAACDVQPCPLREISNVPYRSAIKCVFAHQIICKCFL